MPRKQIKRKCGHIENIYLEDREFNDPAALKHHEDEICEKCYVSTVFPLSHKSSVTSPPSLNTGKFRPIRFSGYSDSSFL